MIDKATDYRTWSKKDLVEFMESIRTDIIRIDKPSKNADHPTIKPPSLVADGIQNSSQPGELVLDPFGGSGSTLIACEQTDRKCYTLEIDPVYVEVIIQRWEKLTGKKANKI